MMSLYMLPNGLVYIALMILNLNIQVNVMLIM